MISFFRKFFGSKLGLGLTLAFLALIALAFASSDVANTGTFGGVSGGDRVAVIGSEKIGNADFMRAANSAVEQVRRENPTITMQSFVAQGGLDEVLQQMVDRYTVGGYAEKYGLRAGENLINSEILQFAAFRGPDGNFSNDAYQAALRQQGITETVLRRDLADSLLASQMIVPAISGTQMPSKVAMRYAALLRERRQGAVGFIPSASFAPTGNPTDEQLNAYYSSNREDYIRPERRVIRWAVFGAGSVGSSGEPTEAEIAERYERDAEQYAAREDRTFTQLIVPTEQAANSLRDRVTAGASLAAVAREAGFSTTTIGPADRQDYAELTSNEVAAAAFAAPQGQIAQPARSSLGWYVVRVDRIDRIAERPLAAVTPEITEQLRIEKRAAALSDLSARVEEQLEDGVAFTQVVERLGVDMNSTPPVTADGRVYGNPAAVVAPQLQGAINTAFQMDEGEPQLAEVQRGTTFMLFEVSEITPAAAAPLAEIRPRVTAAWRLAEGNKLAREAADRVLAKLDGDATLSAAMAAEEKPLPSVDQIDLNREQLLSQGQQIPPALALMFSMAEGTSKRLEAPNNLGWFIVDLDDISTDEVAANDPLVTMTRSQIREAMNDEIVQQLTAAMRAELGVETNPDAIEAVRRQLVGEN